ncbi:putative membrane protein [Litorivivens lipolytica]|uniref:Putative membrane protein n=1 Tax=Litorivivens lipolytica TaxID=1524264 RepID=A0A7W4W4N4_9GAMM|nr:DUF2069 domain-containing protein [Litorivivens lipolytica]MBB3047396.1 putative membrane protein [Litorivivens lipolytica]
MREPKIPDASAESLQAKADLAWRVLLVCFVIELVVLTLTTWWLHQEGRQPSLTIWLVRIVPLLVFVPGMLKRNPRSLAWLCFVILMYFMIAVTEAMSPLRLWINHIEVALSVVIFLSAMMTIRWQAQAERKRRAVIRQE